MLYSLLYIGFLIIFSNVPFGVIIFLHLILMHIFIKLFKTIKAFPMFEEGPAKVSIYVRFFLKICCLTSLILKNSSFKSIFVLISVFGFFKFISIGVVLF